MQMDCSPESSHRRLLIFWWNWIENSPKNPEVLGFLANAYIDLENSRGYLHTLYKLHNLMPNRAEIKLGLAGACLANNYPAFALKTFHQFLKRWPRDERASDVQKTIHQIETSVTDDLNLFKLVSKEDLDLACQHEELQILMELGNFVRCRQLAKAILRKIPDFVPVLNNLSLINWLEGNLMEAVEVSRKVLDIQPDNIHALSNLTRFLFMQGKKEEAFAIAERLKNSRAEAAEPWVKKVEALSFIEDNEGVLALLDQAKRNGEASQLNGAVWHWCAASEYRRGNISAARAYWQKCLELAPYHSLAADNLKELEKPAYQRVCPQVFSLNAWLPERVIRDWVSVIHQNLRQTEEKVQEKLNRFVADHPELLQFIPAAVSAGDRNSKEFALELADMISDPVTLDYLKEFGLGKDGPDDLRMKALQILSKNGVFESGQKIKLWSDGQWREILMHGFEIVNDASGESPLKPRVYPLMEKSLDALRGGDGATAEGYLRKALKIQPDEPSLHNNLALALNLQGRIAEADTLADQIVEQFPDYFFGQIIAARRAIDAEDFERAAAILGRLMETKRLHITEYSALCACHIDFLIAKADLEGVASWFQMWRNGYPEDPTLKRYEARFVGLEGFQKLARLFKDDKPKNGLNE